MLYQLPRVITSVRVLLTLNAAGTMVILRPASCVLGPGGLGFMGLGLPESTPERVRDLQQVSSILPRGEWCTGLFSGLAMLVQMLGLSFLEQGLEGLVSGGDGPSGLRLYVRLLGLGFVNASFGLA